MKILFSRIRVLSAILLWLLAIPGIAQLQLRSHKYSYDEITLEEMIRRYISKTHPSANGNSIEGLYTVSAVVLKKSRSLLGGRERERVVNRKDNYATVAILKDWPGSTKEYVEVSLNSTNAPEYPIVGEVTVLADNAGYLFKHFEPDGAHMTFTFTRENPDLLQGAYSFQHRKAMITYRLSYMKIYPQTGE